jgi:hypothetical protein
MEYYNNQILANFALASATRWQAIWDSYKKPMRAFPANWADSYHISKGRRTKNTNCIVTLSWAIYLAGMECPFRHLGRMIGCVKRASKGLYILGRFLQSYAMYRKLFVIKY